MAFGIPSPESQPFIDSLLVTQHGNTILLGLIITMIMGALVGWLAQSRIRYYRTTKMQVRERKIRAKHLLRILEGLVRTNCDTRVRQLLGERLIEIIEEIMDINPAESGVKIIYAATQKLMTLPPQQTVYKSSKAENNHEVKDIQNLILASIAQIKKLPRRGKCTYFEARQLQEHLKMIYVQVEVDANIVRADLAAESGDRVTASTHYRIAQSKLAQSKYHGKEKRQQMVEIGNTIRALYSNSQDQDKKAAS